MSVVLFRRDPRRHGPEMPSGELQLQEPPSLPDAQSGTSGMLTYAPMALSSFAMVLIFVHPGGVGGGGSQAITYVAVGMMAVSAIGMLVSQLLRNAGDRKRQIRTERGDYLRYLGQTRRQVRRSVVNQQHAMLWRHPHPTSLRSLVRSSRLWERRATHPDFGEVRLAVGEQRLGMNLASMSTKPVNELEPLAAHALRRFIRAYATVQEQPIAVFLRAYARIQLRGDRDAIRGMARSMLTQLAAMHAPDDLRILLVTKPEERAEWDWVKWLPHAQHPVDLDGAGPTRLVADGVGSLESMLGAEFAGRPPFDPEATPSREEPYLVIVIDSDTAPPQGHRVTNRGYRNAVVIDLAGAMAFTAGRNILRLRVDPAVVEMVDVDRTGREVNTTVGRPDRLGQAGARAIAALIAPYRLHLSTDTSEPLSTNVQLTTLLGITDLHGVDMGTLWQPRGQHGRLRVPLGITSDGSAVELDLKESAQGGMGPHGMLIGATGSGKSELLRTLVTALALTHPSETLNFVLVDFKGGATFLGLDELPHTSAVITNLEGEGLLVGRMRDALQGELMRRQELLRSAGNYASVLEYERARATGVPLSPLPSLLVVVDEFSELLAAHREFMDLFVMIGRLGRSLGVHLLLASQRLDEGRTHQLESHLSYRIGLRTFSAMESRGVLGVPDAYQLPSEPGNGYLKTDTETLTRFKAAYVSGAYRPRDQHVRQSVIAGQIVPYTCDHVEQRQQPQEPQEPDSEASGPSLLQIAVERLRGVGTPAQQVWLPPLDAAPALDTLLPPLLPDPQRGLSAVGWTGGHAMTAPVGMVDRPFNQRRDLLIADLSGGGGHVGVVGGPQSGKSTLIRTLMLSLALTHTPREVQFYCLDFGGGTLGAVAGLPHVGSVTGRLDLERLNRTVAEIDDLISRRERDFAARGIDSMSAFRQIRATGEPDDDPYGDVFLVVDGWSTVRQDFPDLAQVLALIASRGLAYGVHLIVGANRWADIHTQLRDQLGTRLELRLGDPIESHINMRIAATVPKVPGRGLTDASLHFLSGLPRIDGVSSTADLSDAVSSAVETIAGLWPGPCAPSVRMLPGKVDARTLPAPEGDLRMPLGLSEEQLQPFWHDFSSSPHLLVVGDAESGKTNVLRLVAQAITRRFTPQEARLVLVDYRRELFDSVPQEYRLGYAVSLDVAREMADGAAQAMAERVPPADLSPDRLRARDWYTGARLYLLVDDYDLVASTPGANPFAALLDHLALGTEIGLHLVVARSANGISRGLGDPLLRRMQEVNSSVVLLSCPPSEGRLFNDLKPRTLPPGRAMYVTRRRVTQIQTATAEREPDSAG